METDALLDLGGVGLKIAIGTVRLRDIGKQTVDLGARPLALARALYGGGEGKEWRKMRRDLRVLLIPLTTASARYLQCPHPFRCGCPGARQLVWEGAREIGRAPPRYCPPHRQWGSAACAGRQPKRKSANRKCSETSYSEDFSALTSPTCAWRAQCHQSLLWLPALCPGLPRLAFRINWKSQRRKKG